MRILVVTGATGGHIYPALGFIESLQSLKRDVEVLLVLPKIKLKSAVEAYGVRVAYISVSSIRLNTGIFVSLFKFIKGIFESIAILLRFKPDVVIGFGSLVCIPLVISARILGKKVVLHEQNVTPGRANRFLAPFAGKIAVSFGKTRDFLKVNPGKIILTGNPLRKSVKKIGRIQALQRFGFNAAADKFTILVTGGSQGSRSINQKVIEALSGFEKKDNLRVIHLTGEKDYDELSRRYRELRLEVKVFSFFKDMEYAYSCSDLAISRAGATTISELIFFSLPAIIIPYPFAYQHQEANAQVLAALGAAVVINEKDLNPDVLRKELREIITIPGKIAGMKQGYNKQPANGNAGEILAQTVLSL